MKKAGDEEPAKIFICQGPPRCNLECDEAIAAMEAGCIWCRVETLTDGGDFTVTEPPSC